MHNITYKEIISIVDGFSEYISKMKSKNEYVLIIKEYLLNEVRNQVNSEDYTEIFSEERIKDFHLNFKRSLVVRSALNKLKKYLISQGKLDKYFNFEFEHIGTKEKADKTIISLNDIQNIR